MGTGSFSGVKRPGRGADDPPHLSAEVMKGYGYTSYLYSPSGPQWPVIGSTFTLPSYDVIVKCVVVAVSELCATDEGKV